MAPAPPTSPPPTSPTLWNGAPVFTTRTTRPQLPSSRRLSQGTRRGLCSLPTATQGEKSEPSTSLQLDVPRHPTGTHHEVPMEVRERERVHLRPLCGDGCRHREQTCKDVDEDVMESSRARASMFGHERQPLGSDHCAEDCDTSPNRIRRDSGSEWVILLTFAGRRPPVLRRAALSRKSQGPPVKSYGRRLLGV